MQLKIRKRINYYFYFFTFCITALILNFISKNQKEFVIFLTFNAFSIFNLYLFKFLVKRMLFNKEDKLGNAKKAILSFGKILIFFVTISFGVLFIGDRIIIPVFNHVIQIIFFGLAHIYFISND